MEHLTQILELLNREKVEYVLIGGLAAVVHGVPLATRDVDVCMPLTEQNLKRLEQALAGLNPFHRQTPQRMPFSVAADFPRGLKNIYLRCDLGVLDCLGEVLGLGSYEEVKRRCITIDLPIGECRVLDLPALIQAKEAAGRTQDHLALLHLRKIQAKKSNL